jgi:hypothetical protein
VAGLLWLIFTWLRQRAPRRAEVGSND